MKTKTLLCLWLPLALLSACAKFQEPLFLSDAGADGTRISINIHLPSDGFPDDLSEEVQTRSSWNGDPDRVDSFVLMAYREGCLESCVRARAGAAVRIDLFKGKAYQLYALANVPDFVPPPRAVEMEALSLPVGDFQQRSFLPMACRVDAFVPRLEGQALNLSFERLFARLRVHLDKGALGLLRIGSLRLRQVASYVHPFAATDAECSFLDGDAASDDDLQRLNAGDNLILYVPQNRQGCLLPGNDNPFLRVPDSLGAKAGQCTYLELSASQDGETLLSGGALCRVYLGLNAADNFDVPGNTSLDLTLFLTDRLLGGDWGWRIDSNLSWRPDAVTGWLDAGMHALDDLYVGEVFRYAVRPSEAFLEAIGDDFSRCSLCFRPDADASPLAQSESDTTILFSSWTASGDGVWLADAHCRRPVDSGRIRLCLDGNELFDLATGLAVQVPAFALQAPSTVYINADTLSVCSLEMRDRQGRSLAAAYGFDPDVFSLEYALTVNPEVAAPAVSSFSRLSICPPSPTAPFGTCAIGISHTGANRQLSRFLTESLQQGDIIHLRVRDTRYAVESLSPIRTDIQTIRVRLCEEGADSAWTFYVDNPSALPLDWGLVVMPYAQYQCEAAPPPSCRSLPVIQGPGRGYIFANREKISSSGIRDSLVLEISPSVMAARFLSCGYSYHSDELGNIGLEPALSFGSNRDARLDGKIELECELSGGTPVFCLFASASETWSGQALFEPVWLRYSAYEDIGQVQLTAGFSSEAGLPTVCFNTDRDADDHLFTAVYYGYINGSVYGEPSNPWTQSPIQFNPRLSFIAAPEKMSMPDGQPHLCTSGTFLSQYRQILQYEQDSGSQYTYYPRIQSIEYGVSIACEPVDRIYSPVVSGTLRHARYSNTEGISYYVGSTLTEIVQDMLYLF